MDKFLLGKSSNSTKDTSVSINGGLLSVITNSKESNSSVCTGWQERENSVLGMTDIACDRNRQIATARNFVGWKTTSEGQRIYTTFRNGHKVAAHGHEGFKLAKGDELKQQRKKERNFGAEADTANRSKADNKRKADSNETDATTSTTIRKAKKVCQSQRHQPLPVTSTSSLMKKTTPNDSNRTSSIDDCYSF